MPPTIQVALIAVPLAAYLYALGIFHGGKHPRVVAGPVDLAWLSFGLFGLVAFGPFGRVVVAATFGPAATPAGWLAWALLLAIMAACWTRTGRDRTVIYHAAPEHAEAALVAALGDLGGAYVATLHGYEDRATRTSILLRTSARTRTAVVDVQGDGAGAVAGRLRKALRVHLATIARPVSTLSTAFFAASSLLMLAPVATFLALDPQGRRAIRAVARWLGWG